MSRIVQFILPFSIFFLGCGRAPVQEREVEFTEFRSSASTEESEEEGGGYLDLGGGGSDLGGPKGYCGCDDSPDGDSIPKGKCPTIGKKKNHAEWRATTCFSGEYPECSEWSGCYYDIFECECKEPVPGSGGRWECTLVDMTIEPCENTFDPWWGPS